MKCINCGNLESKVIDSRQSIDGDYIKRRRECVKCGYRWNTFEAADDKTFFVKKNDNSVEAFDETKIERGLITAFKKRPILNDRINDIVSKVKKSIYDSNKKEVESKLIGELVIKELKKIDEVAYVRYASVYRSFSNVDDFYKELKMIKEKNVYQVAIDGPAGSGKSSVAKMLSKELGIDYLDTGAMYRSIAYKAIKNNISLEDVLEIENLLSETEIDFDNNQVILDGKKIGDEIRTEEISKAASDISAFQVVREKLVSKQREIGEKKSIVAEGRDIGTNVFKNAKYKFFITATPEVRAKRRFNDYEGKGPSYEEVLKEIKKRDENDSSRALNPLTKAEDALKIDTTNLEIEEVLGKILSYIKE